MRFRKTIKVGERLEVDDDFDNQGDLEFCVSLGVTYEQDEVYLFLSVEEVELLARTLGLARRRLRTRLRIRSKNRDDPGYQA